MIERIKTWFRRREYENNIKTSMFSSLALFLNRDGMHNGQGIPHPSHEKRIPFYKDQIKEIGYFKTISFGDSILDLSREEMDNIEGNFNVSGEWAEHTNAMINALFDELVSSLPSKVRLPPKNIVIGCLGGNPMLVYQDYEYIKRTTLECLDNLRSKFPLSNIIVYGLPPNYSINALSNAADFEWLVYNWTINNRARFVSLYTLFSGFFPKARWSSDGIHLTPYGAYLLNKKIGGMII